MDRLNIDQTNIDNIRAEYAALDNNEPDPLDQLGRADVCPGTLLKRDDDVAVIGSLVRVIGPGTGRAYFLGWGDPEIGTCTYGVADITDRAPADPEEEPMPVVPPEPLP